ncbi:hypothetical protein [Jiella flava]|uniref:hypothetical protein n=1 Tax=Jiella flava TaxID=2816857 RepID=UPI001E62068B|nr:hypothetical protein [Jiella flava]
MDKPVRLAMSAREIGPFAMTVRITAWVDIFRAIGVCSPETIMAIALDLCLQLVLVLCLIRSFGISSLPKQAGFSVKTAAFWHVD